MGHIVSLEVILVDLQRLIQLRELTYIVYDEIHSKPD